MDPRLEPVALFVQLVSLILGQLLVRVKIVSHDFAPFLLERRETAVDGDGHHSAGTGTVATVRVSLYIRSTNSRLQNEGMKRGLFSQVKQCWREIKKKKKHTYTLRELKKAASHAVCA